jgi:putative DNA primase/helicase
LLLPNQNEFINSKPIYDQRDNATDYIRRGWSPIAVRFRAKEPVSNAWQKIRMRPEDIDRYFPGEPLNIGVHLGEASSGLVDVDLDDDDAVQFASAFLPQSNAVFGRASRRGSHRLYRSLNPGATRKLKAAGSERPIVELRSTGAFTVFPGSVHESGEPILFEASGEPADASFDELQRGIIKIALATTLFQRWERGSRHSLSMAMAGFLLARGWNQDEVEELILAVAQAARDEELDDRLRAIEDTFAASRWGRPVSGRSSLIEALDERTVRDFEKWMGVRSGRSPSGPNAALDLETDSGCADAFVGRYAGELIYSDFQGQWYRRRRDVYEPVSPEMVQGQVKQFLQDQVSLNPTRFQSLKALLGRARINAVAELSRAPLREDYKLFDRKPTILGCADGSLLDLDAGMPYEGEDTEIVTRKLGTVYDPEATCPLWDAFLDRIFESDDEVISFLYRAIGYTLSGFVSENALFMLIGTGANGKSTFISSIMKLMGDYGTSLPMQTLVVQRHADVQTNDLASLAGARFAAASEGEASQRLAESKIKLVTGGDRIKCRFLYRDYFEFEPQFKLFISTNNLPLIAGTDNGIWRRIKVVVFPVSIPAEQWDTELAGKLATELPGILNRAVKGYQEWKEKGLCPPAKVINATKSYRQENDIVQQWIDAECVLNPSIHTSMKDLYKSYCDWCEVNGFEAKASPIFGKELTSKGFEHLKKKAGNCRRGLELAPQR